MTSKRENQPHGTFLMDFRNNAWMRGKQPKHGLETLICTVLIVSSEARSGITS